MSNYYEIGYSDFENGNDPISDSSAAYQEYMRGYNDAKHDSFWSDVSMMAQQDAEETEQCSAEN